MIPAEERDENFSSASVVKSIEVGSTLRARKWTGHFLFDGLEPEQWQKDITIVLNLFWGVTAVRLRRCVFFAAGFLTLRCMR